MAQAAMVGGSMVNAAGAIYDGITAQNAANYNAQMDLQNATLARQQGAQEEARIRYVGAKTLGEGQAAVGASGVQRDGSALDVLQDNAAHAELDALSARHAGELKAIGFERDSALQTYQGKVARTGSYIRAASSILGRAGQAYGNDAQSLRRRS